MTKGPTTTKAIKTVRAVAPLAETPPEKAKAGRAMSQVETIEAGNDKVAGSEAMAAPSHQGLANSRTPSADTDKRAADTARYEALAREHGADLSEEGLNER